MNAVILSDDLIYKCICAVALASYWERTHDGDFESVVKGLLFVREVIVALPINVQKILWAEIKRLEEIL
jgi:hypothetical protein